MSASRRVVALGALLWAVGWGAAPSSRAEPESGRLERDVEAYLKGTVVERRAIAEEVSTYASPDEVLEAVEAHHARRPKRRAGLQKRTIRVGSTEAPYIVVAPRGYDPDRAWPVHISLHGGGRAARYNERTCWNHDWRRRAPTDTLLVCPTTPGGTWWTPQGEAMAMAVYREVIDEWRVDGDRVSIGGMSNGGTGAWHLTMKYPWLWSGVVPRCAGEIRDDRYVENIAKLPVYMIHGDRDRLIPVEASLAMKERLQRVGNEPRLTIHKGGAHRFFSKENRQVSAWLRGLRRKQPLSITYQALPDSDQNPPGLAYWIHAPGARKIRAQWSQGAQGPRLDLTGEDLPAELLVYVPPSLVAVGRPLEVRFKERAVHGPKMIPSTAHALESYRLSRDPQRTYTVGVRVTLPRPVEATQSEGATSGSETQRTP